MGPGINLRELDHLRPPLGLLGDELAEFRGRHHQNRAAQVLEPPVCTENSVRVDYVSESPNVSDDGRSVLPLPGPVRLAVQVEEPT